MNNNIINPNNFIGITHIDNIKLTSNILEQHILAGDIRSSNYTSNASNILNNAIINLNFNCSNYASNISNILNINSSNYTDALRHDVNKWINEETEPTIIPSVNLTHTYIYSSNLLGEIRFSTKGTPQYISNENKKYIIRIKENGAFELYYQYSLLYPTVLGGWYNIMDSIRDAYAYQATNTGLVGQIQYELNKINSYIIALESGLGALATNVELLNGTTVEDIESIISDAVSLNLGSVFNNASILGISGLGILAIITGTLSNILYNQFLTGQIKELEKMNNQNITEAQKASYIEQIKQKAIENLNEFNINLRSLNDANGYINSNITDLQYISHLKCDNLYLNNGNISNINGITTNELIASGKIKQNGILLDNTYLTSNHLYNLAYTYTAERQYPPKAYNTTTQQSTTMLLNKLVYMQTLYLDNSSISFGSGFYNVYSSSSFDTPTTKDKLFNYNTIETTTAPRWAINQYNSGTGNYQADNSIDGIYYGDWVILKLPKEILLSRYRIYQRSDFLTKAPAEWKCYGSKDGINFIEISEASQTTRLTSYSGGYFEKSLNSTFNILYQYIGFTFKSLLSTSGQTDLSFSELQLFGKEILSNTITSNIYTTSNVVKGIIRNEMSDIPKRKQFLVSIPVSSIFVDATTSTTFYKWDLDLRNYTTTQIIPSDPYTGDLLRVFKFSCWYVPSYFGSYINKEPYVINYTIYMSNKSNAIFGRPETAGINIYAVGFPENIKLENILPNNLMLLKNFNSNFNYLTILSRTAPCDLYVIIEDQLF